MKLFTTRKLSLLLLCFVFITISIIPVMSQDEDAEETEGDEEDEPPPTCKKLLFSLVRKILTSALSCLGGRLPLRSPFELATRFYCLIKCTLSAEGILNEEGVLDEVPALFYFQENIPKAIIDSLIGAAQPCLELAKGFNPKEYYCQSYAPFTQCVLPVFVNNLGPYALDCFGTPSFGLIFALINAIVPRAEPSEASNELRKRLAAADAEAFRLRRNNGTTILPSGNNIKRRTTYNSTIRYPLRRNNYNYGINSNPRRY